MVITRPDPMLVLSPPILDCMPWSVLPFFGVDPALAVGVAFAAALPFVVGRVVVVAAYVEYVKLAIKINDHKIDFMSCLCLRLLMKNTDTRIPLARRCV